ncbi:exopolysaccharide production negative regulator [Devosia pacifica]|uniref:Exopolysaccharide production negative regulator n=1 Tax=Devosia pacifica TaxID=1335967 RepID=A0A918RUX1_9HYPH|nr:tetratricopeptide repeat protein [Devosia pacifica]GHA10929.1 exopolysaccharide production negative regulator [Devosia pacifica]
MRVHKGACLLTLALGLGLAGLDTVALPAVAQTVAVGETGMADRALRQGERSAQVQANPSHLAQPQSAVDAALGMANMLDGAGGGVSRDQLLSALENAAAAGQPMALWQLGTMYENGEGVAQDPVKAFGYFSQIANQHADAAPRGLEADIVAQSFVKVGDYYRDGLPGAGIKADADRSHALLMHAASYFGDADAQYRVGMLYLEENELGVNPLQSARWLSLAARKGHGLAQAKLGELLYEGIEGIEAQPVEGLMWMNIAKSLLQGTGDEAAVDEIRNAALAEATEDERLQAANLATQLGPQFSGQF